MSMRELCQAVYEQTAPSIGDPGQFVKYDRKIRQAIADLAGVKVSIKTDWLNLNEDWLRVSVVASELTSLYLLGNTMTVKAYGDAELEPYWTPTVTVSSALFEHNGYFGDIKRKPNGEPELTPGFMYPEGNAMHQMIKRLGPLAGAGRLLIRQQAVLSGMLNSPDEVGAVGKVLRIDPDAPGEAWVYNGSPQVSVRVATDSGIDPQVVQVATIVVPYVSGIPLDELAKLLDDEEHNLADFRASLRVLIAESQKDHASADEVLNDIVRPATSRIERRFRLITSSRRMKLAGWLFATAGTSLAAYTAHGWQMAVAAMLGGGKAAADLLSDHQRKLDELADMPHHLLWKLGRLRQRSR